MSARASPVRMLVLVLTRSTPISVPVHLAILEATARPVSNMHLVERAGHIHICMDAYI